MKKGLILLLMLVANLGVGNAMQHPHPLAHEPRIKLINYNPNAVHYYTGYYGYQSSIVFERDEVIGTISMGNSVSWQLIPQDNRLFLKPIEQDADTNVTIMTNKRVYHFEFHAQEAGGMDDPNIAYEVRFVYLDNSSGGPTRNYFALEPPDLSNIENKNFNYTVSGSEKIAPTLVFDDGINTYLGFKNIFPAIFLVDLEGKEGLVNFKVIDENLVVIEGVDAVFTLRYGNDVACLFNENIKYEKKQTRKRKTGVLMRKNKEEGL